ncbi:hypothetical protein [Lentimicrobium sp.]|nr:hypothetical protein [Lentimicrobium sp.]
MQPKPREEGYKDGFLHIVFQGNSDNSGIWNHPPQSNELPDLTIFTA